MKSIYCLYYIHPISIKILYYRKIITLLILFEITLYHYINLIIGNSMENSLESGLVMRNHGFWEVVDSEPSKICSEIWLYDSWSIVIVLDTTEIDYLGSLDRSHSYYRFTIDTIWFSDDSYFFSRLSECCFSEKFIRIDFSSWKCPKIWPHLSFVRSLQEEHMGTMLTDEIGSSGNESTRHKI